MSMSQFLPYPELRALLRSYPPDERYRKLARSRLIFSALIEPLRWYEKLRYGRLMARTQIEEPPIFLLGFGRSGTTHLHNLMWKDGRFGVVSTYQASMHPIALMGRGWLPRLFANQLPRTRPMDNVAIDLQGPQEEEMAMINATRYAPLHFMSFPRELPGMYDRYVTEMGRDPVATAGWKAAYLEVLGKAQILSGGKRLVLKTPPNTGRIRELLEMFPEARFVHIVRNPYPVYQSMRNMYRKVLPRQVLQELDWDVVDRFTLEAYPKLMNRYLTDRKLIPPGRLVEIRYEDLDHHPIETLETVYRALELCDFEPARSRLEEYVASLGGYQKNRFDFPAEVIRDVNENWGLAFEAFGYERIEPGESPEQ
jgi:hypothetical protein